MRRYFEALRPVELPIATDTAPEGMFLVRVARAQYRWHRRAPHYNLRLAILKPKQLIGSFINCRLECSPRAMWKFIWFLREFGYDPELLRSGEIDEQVLVDCRGIIKVSQSLVRGTPVLELDAFAAVDRWEELAANGRIAPLKTEVPL